MKQNQENKSIKSLVHAIQSGRKRIDCTGVSGSEKAYIISNLYKKVKKPILTVFPSSVEAERFLADMHFFSGHNPPPLLFFPSYNILPFKFIAYHNETAAQRIRILYQLVVSRVPYILITTVDALLQRLIPKKEISNYAELIMKGEAIGRDFLIEKLISGGYARSAIVEEPGDFSIRGGILDIFSPMYSDPVRIELFGDTVDSLRFFSAVSQRKTENIAEAVILPAREVVLKKDSLNQVFHRIRQQASSSEIPGKVVNDIVNRIKNEGVFPGIESLIPLIYPRLDTLFDYVPDNSLYVVIDPVDLEKAAEKLENKASRNFLDACSEDRFCVEPQNFYMKWVEAKEVLSQKSPLYFKILPVSKGANDDKDRMHFHISVENNTVLSEQLKDHKEKENLLSPLAKWIQDKQRAGYSIFLVCSTESQRERLKYLLMPYGIEPSVIDGFPDFKRDRGLAFICPGRISCGFVWPQESLAIITEDEVFGAKHRRRGLSRQRVRTELLSIEELKKGDPVVHSEHGIGRYNGLIKLKVNRVVNDFLLIVYRDEDKLYLPVDRMNAIQKYIGVDGITPVIDKMGGKSWERIKNKAKKSVEKIAGELLEIYAQRKVRKGHAFTGGDSYFQDFEAGFSYEETPDQLKTIEDVLLDMEMQTSMDRLVCGDVGYGKTEVALRASFKAVNDSKQVAVLVPTTVLAEQHFKTFSSRFENYPVNIACLSRFRSPKEQREIVKKLKTGAIDVIIGTHRILQKDIAFKDLGLVVIDEEQRFGVKHKEKLKKIRSMVDVLALTATPIPRTLHMSLMGIRDISVISTPPDQRHPIITYISEFDDATIVEAIRKELDRGGQIFFIHNNIANIWKIAKYLRELIPEVRIGVAHSRLSENELEEIMLKFINKEIDMLVCTTIVESGLDIPSANTIFINRADRFGLAQIYQLRGRVGRSGEQAYAYLFIPKESALSKDAQKRLKVLMEHSDLGSGFQIAMNDLQIRGGGTALGASQSGHIAALGYDMFLKLMENAIAELKGEPVIEPLEPEINITISAFIPEAYIPDIDQRLSTYRNFSKMKELKEISELKEELVDRYGALPAEVANLFLKIMLKILSIKAGVRRLDLTGQRLFLYFSELHQKHAFGIVDMITSEPKRFKFTPDHVLQVRLSQAAINASLAEIKNILKEIAEHVNS